MPFSSESAWHYRPSGFKDFVKRLTDKSMTVSDALWEWREIKCLSNSFKLMTVQNVVSDPKNILRLFEALRIMQPESKFKSQYYINKTERQQELKDNLADLFSIDKDKTHARVVLGTYKDIDPTTGQVLRQFNYALEIAVGPRTDLGYLHAGEIEIIGGINDSVSVRGGELFFSGGLYKWYNKKGEREIAHDLRDILAKCGFNTYSALSQKRAPSVMLINLQTPCPDWEGAAGKSGINLGPYVDIIAETVYNLAYKIPSYRGKLPRSTTYKYFSEKDESQEAKSYLKSFLIKRRTEVEANPSIKVTGRITQRGVWYRIRRIMEAAGFEPRKDWGTTGRTIAGSIRDVIRELWPYEEITREDLGIIASSRGQMLYNGESYPVKLDTIEQLAKMGIAIIIVEKEGIADLLERFAKEYGIALVHTQGRLTLYAIDLIEKVKRAKGSIVAILVDYDLVGSRIAKSTKTKTLKIGLDKSIVGWLKENGFSDVTIEDLEEEYEPSEKLKDDDDSYLATKRIELDRVEEYAGIETLWKYIVHRLRLKEFSPEGFNYDKIENIMPATKDLYPDAVMDVLSYLDSHIDNKLEIDRQRIRKEIGHARELIEINVKKDEIKDTLSDIVAEDKSQSMHTIIEKFKDLMRPGALPPRPNHKGGRENPTNSTLMYWIQD